MSNVKIIPISAFKDNYIWLFYDETTRHAWVVDPGDALPVIQLFKQLHLELNGILLTHHHPDHSGGIHLLLNYWPKAEVIGAENSSISFITKRVKEGDKITCDSVKLSVLNIPGHTLDHLAYYNSDWLFCGDTLFSFGCGRVFEGTPEQMYLSLNKLLQLPKQTKIYCGHEYTLANLYFAQHVEPKNTLITEKINATKEQRESNNPSLPSILSIEKSLNPFLRCHEKPIITAVENHFHKQMLDPVTVFTYLREWKNKYIH